MRIILCALLVFAAAVAQAGGPDLAEDPLFQPGDNKAYEEDEIDRAHLQNQKAGSPEKAQDAETIMKIEMNQAAPSLISAEEAMTDAEKLELDSKKRQKAILNELAGSSDFVKNCIKKNNKSFRGTYITLTWLISPLGKVQKADIKATDINDLDIRDCIKRAAALFDFSDGAGKKMKKSMVEYTYRFKAPSL